MKTLVLLVVNLLVTTILAENNVHPKLRVREINSRNGYEGTDGEQKEIEELLRNVQKHLNEGSFNLKEIKSNDNLQVKNSPKRYKIKISSRALQRNDSPKTEHGKTKKYKVVIKRKGVGQKNISAVNFENDLTRRNNGASKMDTVVFKEEDRKEHLLLDTAEIRTHKIVNETRLDQNNASTVESGHLLSQFTDRNDRPLTENAEKEEYKLLLKLKSNEQQIKSAVDTDSDRQPEHRRLKTYRKPQYYNQVSQSYYVNERPVTSYIPNQHRTVQYIPFKQQNLLPRPRQDTKIRYIYQQDGKTMVPYKWTESENPTDRLLLKLDSDADKVFKHNYVLQRGKTAHNVPLEQTEYIGTPNRKPIDWNDQRIFNSGRNLPLRYEYNNERSDYYNVYNGLDRDTSIYYNLPQRPDPTNKGYSYEVTVKSVYKNQNEENKQKPARLRDYDDYNPYSIKFLKDLNQNIQLLKPDLLQDYNNMIFHYENKIPIVETDHDLKEPVYLDRNRGNTAITQPQTINNGLDTHFISEEIDYNDTETKDSSNNTLLNVIPIQQVKNKNQIEDEHPVIDTREDEILNNIEKGKFTSDVDFYEIQTQSPIKPDVTKIKISDRYDVLDLCMKLDVLFKQINLNKPKYVAYLEKFQKLLEQFVKEQPDTPLRGFFFKLLIKVYLVLQRIENPSKSLDTNFVESIASIVKQSVKSVDNKNADVLKVIKQAVKDLEKPVSTESIKPQYKESSPQQERQEPHNSDFIFKKPVTEETVTPTLDTISVTPKNLPESGEIDSQTIQPFDFSENEPNHKVEQPLFDGVNTKYKALPDTESPEKVKFSQENERYSDNNKFPTTKHLVFKTENEDPEQEIFETSEQSFFTENNNSDKQVQIEVDEQNPFDHNHFEELVDSGKDNFNPESVNKYNDFDKEPVISIPNSGKSEETFWEDPDKDVVPANNDVAIKPEQGLYEPEQESGNSIVPESEYIDGPNHQSVHIPEQPKFDQDKAHPAYNEGFELILDSEKLKKFDDSANKPVTDRILIPEINVLDPELVKKTKESGSSGIYIQPITVENTKYLIPPIGETVKILIPEQVQLEEVKQDPVYYEYLEKLLNAKKDNLFPESLKSHKESEIKPVAYENPVLENSEETFDFNPNESNRTWLQINTKPISEYVVQRHFDIPKQVESYKDVHYSGNNDYNEIPRINTNKVQVTNDITPGNSEEVTFTNSKDPVLVLFRELESDADSNEGLTPSDENKNIIDYDLSLKRILEVIENLRIRLRKYNVTGRLIKKILKKVLIITIRKLEENDIKCSERVQFDRFVSLLKRDVGNINFSSENDIVNVSKDELKRILHFEEIVELLGQLFEPRLLLVTRVYY